MFRSWAKCRNCKRMSFFGVLPIILRDIVIFSCLVILSSSMLCLLILCCYWYPDPHSPPSPTPYLYSHPSRRCFITESLSLCRSFSFPPLHRPHIILSMFIRALLILRYASDSAALVRQVVVATPLMRRNAAVRAPATTAVRAARTTRASSNRTRRGPMTRTPSNH